MVNEIFAKARVYGMFLAVKASYRKRNGKNVVPSDKNQKTISYSTEHPLFETFMPVESTAITTSLAVSTLG